jgi:hypothetical protein
LLYQPCFIFRYFSFPFLLSFFISFSPFPFSLYTLLYFYLLMTYINRIWNHFAQPAKTNLYQLKYNKTIQYNKMCETCRPINANLNLACINSDKFNKLITDLHKSIEKINEF